MIIYLFISLCNVFIISIIFCATKKAENEKKVENRIVEIEPLPTTPSEPENVASAKSERETPNVSTAKRISENLSEIYEDPRKLWAEQIVKYKCSEIVDDYKRASSCEPDSACDVFSANSPLNRYPTIKCLDKTRVILDNSSYINASSIRTHHKNREYILTQGPLPNTIIDFWAMIHEKRPKFIVMFCLLVEGGVDKCAQYYPDGEEGEKETYGNFEVTLVSQHAEPIQGVCWNVLEVEDTTKADSKTETNHLMVPWWPDKIAPDDPKLTVELFRWIRKRTPANVPIVVHCDNGIGRSATFVAIDFFMCQIMFDENFSDLKNCLLELRKQRNAAIETEFQFLFVHACILEYLVQIGGIIRRDIVRPFLEDYKEYARKKFEERKVENMKELSSKSESKVEEKEAVKIEQK